METLLYELERSATLAHVMMRLEKGPSSKFHLGKFEDCQSSICRHVHKVLARFRNA